MTDMEAIRWMALWLYRPRLRPSSIIATRETLYRMADGFSNPDSEFRDFAYGMKRAIESRISRAGPLT